jgi:hypothetical protein
MIREPHGSCCLDALIPHDKGFTADPAKVLPDLSQQEPGIVDTPNNAMNAAWRRGMNPANNGSMNERYASNLS